MEILNASILPQTIRQRPAESHKGTYGRIVLIGGNQNFGGAILMASGAAVYAGAGLVTTMTTVDNQSSLHARLPEAMFADMTAHEQLRNLVTGANVVVIGPGLGTDRTALDVLQRVFRLVTNRQTLVIDGSAITLIAQHDLPLPDVPIVMTPHQMEWQRLTGLTIGEQTESQNRHFAEKFHATVVLKSHRTEIYTPTTTYQNPLGTPAQATGGMGDTLAGIIGGFLAQFPDHTNAILAAVYSHSAIAEELAQTQYVVLPHQIIEKLPAFMHQHCALA